MNKLLSASFARLWKNKVFWLGTAGLFLWAVIVIISDYHSSAACSGASVMDDAFFQYAPLIGGFCAIFTSLFLGTDYSDGTVRNKIVAGHSRRAIYLSNLVVSTAAGIMMNASWILAMLTVGIPLLGGFENSTSYVLMCLLITVFMIIAFSSLFTAISMLNQNKAGAAVIALVVFLAILFAASYCNNRLHEPEMYYAGPIITTSDGVVSSSLSESEANPAYVSGNMRGVFEFIVDFLPTGQGILLTCREVTHPLRMLLYSVFLAISTALVGAFSFRKKDLK